MGRAKTTSVYSRAREFAADFFEENNKLMCRFCNISIQWQNKATVTAHLNSRAHQELRRSYNAANRKDRQQSLQSSVAIMEGKRQIITDLVKAWVEADIPIEKIDKLRTFFRKHCQEGGTIPSADVIRRQYLKHVFEQHYAELQDKFRGKAVSLIIDETTDKKARSVVNTLFSYQGCVKLVSVDFLPQVNNITIGQLVFRLLVEWEIPFNQPYLIASDSASYMKKSVREILKPAMPQLKHNLCPAHILYLIR